MKAVLYITRVMEMHGGELAHYQIHLPEHRLSLGFNGDDVEVTENEEERVPSAWCTRVGDVELPDELAKLITDFVSARRALEAVKASFSAFLPPGPGQRKFKKGDRCRVIKGWENLLAGTIVIIRDADHRWEDPWNAMPFSYTVRPEQPTRTQRHMISTLYEADLELVT